MLHDEGPESELTKKAYEVLCKSYASLSQQDQRTVLLILHDIQSGDLDPNSLENIGKSIYDLIYEYQDRQLTQQIQTLCTATGLNEELLSKIIRNRPTEDNINEFGLFEQLRDSMDNAKMRKFLQFQTEEEIPAKYVRIKADLLLREIILIPEKREEYVEKWNAAKDTATPRTYDLSAMQGNYTMAAEADKNQEYGKK